MLLKFRYEKGVKKVKVGNKKKFIIKLNPLERDEMTARMEMESFPLMRGKTKVFLKLIF